jgi:ABC-type transport system involved in cytochrome bd biosynthesis fused ATPase/permease subunit
MSERDRDWIVAIVLVAGIVTANSVFAAVALAAGWADVRLAVGFMVVLASTVVAGVATATGLWWAAQRHADARLDRYENRTVQTLQRRERGSLVLPRDLARTANNGGRP